MATPEALPSKKHLPFGGARALNTPDVTNFIDKCIDQDFIEATRDNDTVEEFLDTYIGWIQSSKRNHFGGLSSFEYASYANGTTEVFDKWYLQNQGRRLRFHRGEYMYHLAVHRNLGLNWKYIEDEALAHGDYVVLSMPFADSGNPMFDTESLLDTASLLSVPVLIDAAYVGLTREIEFDFSHPAVHSVAFSLSKSFPIAHARIGMRLSRYDVDDGLDIYRKTQYNNNWGAALGLRLINKFSPDFNTNRYFDAQVALCDEMNLEPSKTVIFGLGGSNWKDYNRNGLYNRLFLGKVLEKLDL